MNLDVSSSQKDSFILEIIFKIVYLLHWQHFHFYKSGPFLQTFWTLLELLSVSWSPTTTKLALVDPWAIFLIIPQLLKMVLRGKYKSLWTERRLLDAGNIECKWIWWTLEGSFLRWAAVEHNRRHVVMEELLFPPLLSYAQIVFLGPTIVPNFHSESCLIKIS